MYPSPNTGPTATDVAATFIPFFTGSISILGASAILYNILSDHHRRFTAPYFRIMFGLSVADIIFSVTSMTSTFAAPKETPFLFYAAGNQITCEAQSFFLHLGFIQPLYIACLSIYFLLAIKYNVTDDYIAKKYEVWMHLISILYPLIGSIVSAALRLANPTPSACWISEYPPGCHFTDKTTCIRGANTNIYMWIFSGAVLVLSVAVVICCMGSIVFFVRHREYIMNRRFSFRNARSNKISKQSKAVMVQGLLYVGCFILVFIFGSIYRLSRSRPVALLILMQFFWPLQGFCNSIIYFWPRYVKTRDENKDKSFWWILKDMIFTTTYQKEQRRAVLHSVRRRKHNQKTSSSLGYDGATAVHIVSDTSPKDVVVTPVDELRITNSDDRDDEVFNCDPVLRLQHLRRCFNADDTEQLQGYDIDEDAQSDQVDAATIES